MRLAKTAKLCVTRANEQTVPTKEIAIPTRAARSRFLSFSFLEERLLTTMLIAVGVVAITSTQVSLHGTMCLMVEIVENFTPPSETLFSNTATATFVHSLPPICFRIKSADDDFNNTLSILE